MKTFTFVLFLFVAIPASAQTFVESQNQILASTILPQIDAQLEIPSKPINLYGWFQVSNTWGEALLGVSKQITPVIWVSMAAGVETDNHPWRVSPSLFVSFGRVSIFATAEEGGSSLWYKSTGTVRLTSNLEVGVHTQRLYGTGPMAKLSLNHKLAVWGSVVRGSSLLGISKSF